MSHINSEKRLSLFQKAIKSVVNQTLPPTKIRVSFSKSIDRSKDEIVDMLTKATLSLGVPSVLIEINYSCEQHTQFEHLKILLLTSDLDDDDVIFFLDDDDSCHPQRFEMLKTTIVNSDTEYASSKYSTPLEEEESIFEQSLEWEKININPDLKSFLTKNKVYSANAVEFGTLGVRKRCINEYFGTARDDTRCSTEDVGFVSWLRLNKKGKHVAKSLYLYRMFWSEKLVEIFQDSTFVKCPALFYDKNAMEYYPKYQDKLKFYIGEANLEDSSSKKQSVVDVLTRARGLSVNE
jgi:glycosyltransferase involved in cell wall biosynthesis